MQNYSCRVSQPVLGSPGQVTRPLASVVVGVPDQTGARECSQDNRLCDHKHGCLIYVCQLSRGAPRVYLNRLLTAHHFISFVATWGLSHTSCGKWNGVRRMYEGRDFIYQCFHAGRCLGRVFCSYHIGNLSNLFQAACACLGFPASFCIFSQVKAASNFSYEVLKCR